MFQVCLTTFFHSAVEGGPDPSPMPPTDPSPMPPNSSGESGYSTSIFLFSILSHISLLHLLHIIFRLGFITSIFNLQLNQEPF